MVYGRTQNLIWRDFMKKSDTCTLYALGNVTIRNHEAVLQMVEPYHKALKNVGLFSHLILFSHTEKRIAHHLCKIKGIDEQAGIVITDNLDIPDQAIIYDIKPYFPCEERLYPMESPVKGAETIQGIDGSYQNTLKKEDLPQAITVEPIGVFKHLGEQGTLIMNNEFAWNDQETSEYIRVIWWFNRFDESRYRRILVCKPPYENAPKSGMFATRSPVRPNPIASTIVKVGKRKGNRIAVDGFDGFDNSVILDILPYDPVQETVDDATVPLWLAHWESHKTFDPHRPIGPHLSLETSDTERFIEAYITPKRQWPVSPIGAPAKGTDDEQIMVKNAWRNNLKHINVMIPKNKITVITGVSGSGKSTLAFDTLYTESSRQFLSIMNNEHGIQKPEVDEITGLQPAVGIGQRTPSLNPRSTVGTFSGVSELLRSMFATIGVRHCEHCHRSIEALSEGAIISTVRKLQKERDLVVTPFASEEKTVPNLPFEEMVKKALTDGRGAIFVMIDGQDYLLQTKLFCYHCNRMMFDTNPSIFSANNPEYMCKTCKGLGYEMAINPDRIVSNPDRSILDGASSFWGDMRKFREKPNANWMKGEVLALAEEMGVDLELPWKELPKEYRQQVLYGTPGKKVSFSYQNPNGRRGTIEREVAGAANTLKRLLIEGVASEGKNAVVQGYMDQMICSSCNGEKIGLAGRLVEINGMRYPEAEQLSIAGLNEWTKTLSLTEPKHDRVAIIREAIVEQNQRMISMGLGYLSLNRPIPTLSGGEIRRLQLASQFGTNLSNMMYVMDEPTKGLHPKDYEKLMEKIKELRDKRNTIIMVEHKNEIIRQADYIIDIGQGAGQYGGEVIACGTLEEIQANPRSITGKSIDKPSESHPRKTTQKTNAIEIKGAKGHNLKNIDVLFPLNSFICVTGVSGSGKSSLVSQTLYPAVASRLGERVAECLPYEEIAGADRVRDVVLVSQKPIGRTPKSTPATYSGVFDLIREEFARTSDAKKRKMAEEHFSFNGKKGQCEVCNGLGQIKVPMSFMDDIWVLCHHCHGRRYREEILEVRYKGRSIFDVLDSEVRDACALFEESEKITHILSVLNDVGLSYIKLGQSATTLSGGEAQRLKLGKELTNGSSTDTLYILDEPTSGLHVQDTENLIGVLRKLVAKGNTVVAVEHNPDFVRWCDYEIQLGYEGGEGGGYLIG